jgi:hypothetical protein
MEEWYLFRYQRLETWLIALVKLTKSTMLALCVILLLVLSSRLVSNLEVVALSAPASINSEKSHGRVSRGLKRGHTGRNRSEERDHVSRIQGMARKMLKAPTLLISPIFGAQTHGIVIVDIRHVIDFTC